MATYSLAEFGLLLTHCVDDNGLCINGKYVSSDSRTRLKLLQKHPQCKCCGRKGKEWRYDGKNGWNLVAERGRLTIDHIKPISKNGPNTLANKQVLCLQCNSAIKGNKIINSISRLRYLGFKFLRGQFKTQTLKAIK